MWTLADDDFAFDCSSSPPVGPSPSSSSSIPDATGWKADVPEREDGLRRRKSWTERFGDAIDQFVGRFRDASEILRDPSSTLFVHEFADTVTMARDPDQVESALVRLAGTVADASRVELLLDRDVDSQKTPKLVALAGGG